MRLAGKVALITGGSRSIGRAIALGYGREGAAVAVNYRSAEEQAQEVVAQVVQSGSQAIAVQANVAILADVERMVKTVVATFGRLDVLVNNAAILKRTPLLEIREEEWDEVIAVNLKGY